MRSVLGMMSDPIAQKILHFRTFMFPEVRYNRAELRVYKLTEWKLYSLSSVIF
jgi:hypothetical protein